MRHSRTLRDIKHLRLATIIGALIVTTSSAHAAATDTGTIYHLEMCGASSAPNGSVILLLSNGIYYFADTTDGTSELMVNRIYANALVAFGKGNATVTLWNVATTPVSICGASAYRFNVIDLH